MGGNHVRFFKFIDLSLCPAYPSESSNIRRRWACFVNYGNGSECRPSVAGLSCREWRDA